MLALHRQVSSSSGNRVFLQIRVCFGLTKRFLERDPCFTESLAVCTRGGGSGWSPCSAPTCHPALCLAIRAFPPNDSSQSVYWERGKPYVVQATWEQCLVEPFCKRLRSQAGELLNDHRW